MTWSTSARPRVPLSRGPALAVLAVLMLLVSVAPAPIAGATAPMSGLSAAMPAPASYADVPSNVDPGDWLVPPWNPNPEDMSWEPSGAFRTFCEFSHLGYHDPIVDPGNDRFMHLHMFFGNTTASHQSTYGSLRGAGNSTCDGGPLNRTGYWMPAVFDGQDRVVVPDYFELYYKGENTSSGTLAQKHAEIRNIQPYPNGLRMIAGAPNGAGLVWGWHCEGGRGGATIPDCPPGQRLTAWVRFPYCWDGKNLDSADHRSHMAYGTNNTWGGCPSSHPIHLPELSEMMHFESPSGSGQWYLSSDRMNPSNPAPNGSTLHADWFGAWDNQIQNRWLTHCIRGMRSGSNGNLCDGQQLRPVPAYTGPSRISGWQPVPAGHQHPPAPTPPPPSDPERSGAGYWMAAGDGSVHGFGSANTDTRQPATTVAIAAAPSGGYWMLHADGRVTARGVTHHGDANGTTLPRGEHVTTMAGLPDGNGYWIFTNRGRVLPFGTARHRGDLTHLRLNGPVVDAVAAPDGRGYYLVGSDGGVFAMGSAEFRGSTGSTRLNQPVVGLIPTPGNDGYWLIAADGGVFAFDARFRGSVPGVLRSGTRLNRPIIGGVAYGNGYVMIASDGGAFTFSNQPFLGSLGGQALSSPIVGLAVRH